MATVLFTSWICMCVWRCRDSISKTTRQERLGLGAVRGAGARTDTKTDTGLLRVFVFGFSRPPPLRLLVELACIFIFVTSDIHPSFHRSTRHRGGTTATPPFARRRRRPWGVKGKKSARRHAELVLRDGRPAEGRRRRRGCPGVEDSAALLRLLSRILEMRVAVPLASAARAEEVPLLEWTDDMERPPLRVAGATD